MNKVSNASGIGMTSARTRERLVQKLIDQGIRNPAVLQQIRDVPRHLFVDEALATRAYENTALPIGLGQTISQPYIVARMTEALFEGAEPRKVLEIGTGCGYQTAILAPLVKFLYSVERIKALQDRAKQTLAALNSRNVYFRQPIISLVIVFHFGHLPHKFCEHWTNVHNTVFISHHQMSAFQQIKQLRITSPFIFRSPLVIGFFTFRLFEPLALRFQHSC